MRFAAYNGPARLRLLRGSAAPPLRPADGRIYVGDLTASEHAELAPFSKPAAAASWAASTAAAAAALAELSAVAAAAETAMRGEDSGARSSEPAAAPAGDSAVERTAERGEPPGARCERQQRTISIQALIDEEIGAVDVADPHHDGPTPEWVLRQQRR